VNFKEMFAKLIKLLQLEKLASMHSQARKGKETLNTPRNLIISSFLNVYARRKEGKEEKHFSLTVTLSLIPLRR
jgi:phage repressor protein C with HTH and peptisase S24 domain